MGVVGEFSKLVGMTEQNSQEDADSKRRARELRLDQGTQEFAAGDAIARGSISAGLAQMKGTKLAGKQLVAFTAGGVDASVGTAADVIAETALMTELDASTIRNNAAREAWGHKRTADKYGREAQNAADEPARKQTGRILGALGQSANVVASGVKTFGGG